jgi:hypothetical protein
MPPAPPNFIPAAAVRHHNRRRPLDPTRHLQSRELWNKVRFHASNYNEENNNSSSSSSKWSYYKALCQAILYEIQPFRIKPYYHRIKAYLREEFDPKTTIQIALNSIQQILIFIATLLRQYCTIQSMKLYKYTIGKSILVLLILKLYHVTLVYLHELLHAGPILIITTLLILLYTIGLGDNTGAASGVPSAYSVFNRGMQRILGTIDAEELARQYAGGAAAVQVAMGAGAGGEGNHQHHHRNRDAVENDDDENEILLRNERRRQRRLERQRRNNQQEGEGDVIDNDIDNEDNGNDTNAIPNDTLAQEDATGPATETNNEGVARKSGKKARRRNLELRREMQRQRQAAAANGFGRGDGDDIVAMDRLVDGFND